MVGEPIAAVLIATAVTRYPRSSQHCMDGGSAQITVVTPARILQLFVFNADCVSQFIWQCYRE